MFGYDSKVILKQILACVGERELQIEYFRQKLAAIVDFEPYVCFKRLDYTNKKGIGFNEFETIMRQNGYRVI